MLLDLDLLKSGREDVAADLQKSKQAGATWKKEAEEHELKAKDARKKEHQCLESEDAATKNLQVYDSTIDGVMQLIKRRDEAKVYLGHLAEERKRQWPRRQRWPPFCHIVENRRLGVVRRRIRIASICFSLVYLN